MLLNCITLGDSPTFRSLFSIFHQLSVSKLLFSFVRYRGSTQLDYIFLWSIFYNLILVTTSVQFSSVTQSCPTLCDPMDCSTPGLPVHHQFPEFTQTHAHWVDDAIQPSHPVASPSPAFSFSQHQGLFKWVSSSHQMAKILEFQLQHQSFQWTPRIDLP